MSGSSAPEHGAAREWWLPVVEHFSSIQGEGTLVGTPSTFIRVAGCNLRCSWCDTPYSWSAEGVAGAQRCTLDDVLGFVTEDAVVLTGGEPMLYAARLGELVAALRERRGVRHVTVETNGTIFDADLAGAVDLWSLSPKLPGSGEHADTATVREFLRAAPGRVQLKFVVTDGAADWSAMWTFLGDVGADAIAPAHVPILVQPDGTRNDYDTALRALIELVLAEPDATRRARVRVVPQVHRVAWGPAARGV